MNPIRSEMVLECMCTLKVIYTLENGNRTLFLKVIIYFGMEKAFRGLLTRANKAMESISMPMAIGMKGTGATISRKARVQWTIPMGIHTQGYGRLEKSTDKVYIAIAMVLSIKVALLMVKNKV